MEDSGTRPFAFAVAAAASVALVLPVAAFAHIERPAYWPQPRAEKVEGIKVGGDFPKARSLASALDENKREQTHVVCKANSLAKLRGSIRDARKRGYEIRPHDRRKLSKKQAARLLRVNRKLAHRCRYREIQPAVFDADNHDRVVVMPGTYMEPTARSKPTGDPRCEEYSIGSDPPGIGTAATYEGEFHCPNDANLIAIMGRKPGRGEDPYPPRWNRHGIPNLGRCVRCNLQLEGSGVSADDVIVEAGDVKAGNGGPNGVGAEKDVGIRADRADGFVLRNLTVRHAAEHAIYVLESDGYLLDRFKAFYSGLYGTLTFAEDHGVTQNCETVGHADSGIYPGAPVETGEQRPEGTKFRYNQIVRRCDSHHNLAGYSATNGNAVHIHHNNFYDNALGFQTDIATSPGHPGFPDDSQLIERNRFYSNNFNPYAPDSDVEPAFPFPVGTGLWVAGGNNHTIRRNRFYDNWRRGVMLFAIPDVLICGPGTGNSQAGCDPARMSTSHRNRIYENVMGEAPGGAAKPNGLDFWWDSFPGSRENCWFANTGPAPITSDPPAPLLPDCAGGEDPGSSVGIGNPGAEGELLTCLVPFVTGDFNPDTQPCPWFDSPPRPGSAAALAAARDQAERMAGLRDSFWEFCGEFATRQTCERYSALRQP